MRKLWKINDKFIDISDNFIYEVDLFKFQNNCWNLEDTHLYSCLEFIENIVSFKKWIGKDFKIFKYTTLLSAPLNWLKENAKLVDFETKKEAKERKKLEKLNNENNFRN